METKKNLGFKIVLYLGCSNRVILFYPMIPKSVHFLMTGKDHNLIFNNKILHYLPCLPSISLHFVIIEQIMVNHYSLNRTLILRVRGIAKVGVHHMQNDSGCRQVTEEIFFLTFCKQTHEYIPLTTNVVPPSSVSVHLASS